MESGLKNTIRRHRLPEKESPMDFDYPASAEAVRSEVRAWLKEVLPADWAGTGSIPEDQSSPRADGSVSNGRRNTAVGA